MTARTGPAANSHILVLILAAAAAGLLLAGCTTAYRDALNHEVGLAPGELLSLRAQQAGDSLGDARTALLHLDDALRDLTLIPQEGEERAQTDLQRRAEQFEAAAWEARRRAASVHDVAPDALATGADPRAELAPAYRDLSAALDAAEASMNAVLEALSAILPAPGASPAVPHAPPAAEALRAPVGAAIADIERAIGAGDRLLAILQSPPS